MLRVVFDTVVFVRSLLNPYSIWGLLILAHHHRYRLFLSQPVVVEILEVLHRPELTRKFRTLESMDVARVIGLIRQAEVVDVPSCPAVSRDPKDDKFLTAALAAKADYLVTEDRDLLVLGEHEGVRIVDAATFLKVLAELG